ncbi:MAG: preprotein translocase subunit SecG [Pseudomonadota bacterium]
MQNIILIVHLILAICLIAVVLLQRSEGGALGIGGGGGGGGGGLVSSRGAATALSKLTWAIGVGFLCTSIALTIVSDGNQGGSLLNQLGGGGDAGVLPLPEPVSEDPVLPALPDATVPSTAD